MDNRTLDITSEGREALAMAVRIAWSGAAGGKASHYRIVKLETKVSYHNNPTSHHSTMEVESPAGVPTLLLYWHESAGALPLPYPLKVEEAIAFIEGWLESAEFGDEPDHDGSNGRGWRVYTGRWGHIFGSHYGICAVQPAWAMYGK